MTIHWEDSVCYALAALLVLTVFYGIYFGKMLAQKRRGILPVNLERLIRRIKSRSFAI